MGLRWKDVYEESALYKAALGIYARSLFRRQKALSVSLDGSTLFDFARRGLRNLDSVHRALAAERFSFRPGAARVHNLNGKVRTFYIYPWEEKVVDLLLYRLLNERLDPIFSPSSYAYRRRDSGIDLCQKRIARALSRSAASGQPAFLVKRDITRYFDSIDHELLLARLAEVVAPGDYLFRLLLERVRFAYELDGKTSRAAIGVPFGTPIACLFANLYLTGLDERLTALPGIDYFRYADDVLVLGREPGSLAGAAEICDRTLAELRLGTKATHCVELRLAAGGPDVPPFVGASRFRHLGLEFRADGSIGLSRDKARKVRNLFRYAFRRKSGRFRRLRSAHARVELAAAIARRTLETGVRNVAIVDYYLRHVTDESQLRLIDRWLAEEVLSLAFGNGHKKGNFRRISFAELRKIGLPSLVHRRRLIHHGEVETSFFRWDETQRTKRRRGGWRQAPRAFSPGLEAAVGESS